VGQHGALDPAGGAGSEQDGGGIERLGQPRIGHRLTRAAFDLLPFEGLGQIEHPALIAAFTDQRGAAAVGQDQRGGDVIDHPHQFGRRSAAVEQCGNAPGLHHRHEGDDPFGPVAHADGHPVAAPDVQHRGQLIAPGEHLFESQPPFAPSDE
jgi:hypothetical protein